MGEHNPSSEEGVKVRADDVLSSFEKVGIETLALELVNKSLVIDLTRDLPRIYFELLSHNKRSSLSPEYSNFFLI